MDCRRSMVRDATIAGLAAAALLVGPAMAQTASPGDTGSSSGMRAVPQVSPQTVSKAGKAMHNVLAINKSYGDKLQKTSDPAGKQELVAMAKQKATTAITDQGLTVGEYNQVLASARQNQSMRQQLLNAAGVTASN